MKWLIEVWKGNVPLPPEEEMIRQSQVVPGVGSADIPRHFHKMGPAQWAMDD